MATATGSVVSFEMSDGNTGKQHAILGYSTTTTNDKVTIKLTSGKLGRDKGMTITSSFWSWTLSGTGQTSQSGTPSAASYGTSDVTCFSTDKTWTWNRDTSKTTKTVKFATKYTKVSGQSASTATVTVTIPALASYTVTYNNNGGSGTHASQTKYYGKSLTLTTGTHPTRTGYTFNGWNTKANGTGTAYSSSDVAYTANAALTLYAQWNENSYSVTYNANNGSGAPATQTRNYTASATISSAIPTRHLYKFTGWNTAANGSGTSYQPGGTIPANTAANVTLYAQWTLNYTKPVISSSSAMRTNSSGQAVDDDSGTYASISCTWAVDTLPDEGGGNTGTLTATLVKPDSTTSSITLSGNTTGSGGTATTLISNLSVDESYSVIFSLTDGEGNTTLVTLTIPKQEFQLDFSPAGGVGIGTAAPDAKETVIAMPMLVSTWAGIIQMFAGTTPPTGWLMCDGSAVSRTAYAELFAAIGTTWGAGDGSTTFNLPDLRGRAAVGAGAGSGLTARTLGDSLGSENAIVPYHRHTMGAHTHSMANVLYNPETVARRTVASGSGATNQLYSAGATSRYQNTGAMNGTVYTGYEGTSGNTTGANMPPVAVVNFIIHTGKTS